MKKTTMQSLINYLNGTPIDNLEEIRAELEAELAKGAEKAAANRSLYDEAEAVVKAALDMTPVSVAELYEAISEELPDGFSKGKLQYALSRQIWSGIVRIDGTPCTYRKA